jgi:hypothetical protein
MAQTYSQNIVGYVNLPLGNGGYKLVVNPVQAGAVNAESVISSLDAGDQILIWSVNHYNTYTYQGGPNGSLTGTNDWQDQNNNNVVGPSLNPGQGFFYTAQSGDNETNTFTGTVLLTNSIALGSGGYALVGSTPPITGSIAVTNANFNLPLDAGDQVLIWKTAGGYNTYTYQGGPNGSLSFPNDWQDQNNNNVPAPVVGVGQGFFYTAQSGDNETWIQNVTVQ